MTRRSDARTTARAGSEPADATRIGLRELRWSLRARAAVRRVRRSLRPTGRWPDRRPITTSTGARAALTTVTLAYIVRLTYLSIRNHLGFGTSGFDIGIFDQGVWLLSRFQDPFVTVRGLHLFGDHTSFVLLAFVPVYQVFASPTVLLGAQSLALGAGAVPAFLLGRHQLRSEWLAAGCAVAYLAHPAIAWTNLENFHPDAFEVPLVLLAFWFASTRRWRWFAVCVAALLLVKEDVPLLTFPLGIYVALRHHRRIGLATAAVSAAWLAATLLVVLPAFNGVGSLYASRITGPFGGAGGLVTTFVTAPWEVAAVALDPDKVWYVWQLLAPLALLCLLAPTVLAVAVLPLASNLLSTFWYPYHLEYHYSTLIVPVLVVATIAGIARFRSQRVRAVLTTGLVVAAVAGAYLWGPLGRDPRGIADPGSPQAQAAREAIATIPDDAVVSAHYRYVPHLTHRERIYEFPNPWRASNWGDASREGERLPAAADVDHVLFHASVLDDPGDARIVRRLERAGFERTFSSEGVVLLRRPAQGPAR